jgi:hypothetical protein
MIPRPSRVVRLTLGTVTIAALLSPTVPRAQRYVPGSDPAFPRVKYADSLLSLNDRCIVRMNKLNTRVRPVYVSRQPIGFC